MSDIARRKTWHCYECEDFSFLRASEADKSLARSGLGKCRKDRIEGAYASATFTRCAESCSHGLTPVSADQRQGRTNFLRKTLGENIV